MTKRGISDDVMGIASAISLEGYGVIPLSRSKGVLEVAVLENPSLEAHDAIRFLLKGEVEYVLVTSIEYSELLREYQERVKLNKKCVGKLGEEKGKFKDHFSIEDLVHGILGDAIERKASDIHLEPEGEYVKARCRVDGRLEVLREIPLPREIISYLKLQAHMNIDQKRLPQDGRMEWKGYDIRASVIPTTGGESVVLRLLDKNSSSIDFHSLGLNSDLSKKLKTLLSARDGLILTTGPTGSGKTTTLYSILNLLKESGKKIITVEDPVEYRLEGINQIGIRDRTGMSFSSALRSILRQSPDVIMAGEIRDLETAKIVIEASLTGHLVLSSLHTNDAVSAVTRLVDIGIEPYLVASALKGVLSQRLVRKICESCREPYIAGKEEVCLLDIKEGQYYRGMGCGACKGRGTRGRTGVFEFLEMNADIERCLHRGFDWGSLYSAALSGGFRDLREDGVAKIIKGVTNIHEVASILI